MREGPTGKKRAKFENNYEISKKYVLDHFGVLPLQSQISNFQMELRENTNTNHDHSLSQYKYQSLSFHEFPNSLGTTKMTRSLLKTGLSFGFGWYFVLNRKDSSQTSPSRIEDYSPIQMAIQDCHLDHPAMCSHDKFLKRFF